MDHLRVDLDALSRLLPQLRELAEQVKAGIPGHLLDKNQDMVPSLAAAHEMSATTLPAVRRAVADQLTKVAQMVEDARLGFLTSDEQPPGRAIVSPCHRQPPPWREEAEG